MAVSTGNVLLDYASLASMATPFIVAAIVKSSWTSATKSIVAAAVAVIAGSVAVYQAGEIAFTNLAVVIPAVLIASQIIYTTALKPLGLAPWFEKFTSALIPKQDTTEQAPVATPVVAPVVIVVEAAAATPVVTSDVDPEKGHVSAN